MESAPESPVDELVIEPFQVNALNPTATARLQLEGLDWLFVIALGEALFGRRLDFCLLELSYLTLLRWI